MFYINCDYRRFVGVTSGDLWLVFSHRILHVFQCILLANPWPAPQHSTGFRRAPPRSTNHRSPRQSTGSTDHVTRVRAGSGGGARVARPWADPGGAAGGGERADVTGGAGTSERSLQPPLTMSGFSLGCRPALTVSWPMLRNTPVARPASWTWGRTGRSTAMWPMTHRRGY